MLYSYSVSGGTCQCTTTPPPRTPVTLEVQPPTTRIKLVKFLESAPCLLEGYASSPYVETQVGIRLVPAKLLNISLDEKILIRECSTCISALVEGDIFEIHEGKALYWCEVPDGDPTRGECWEVSTTFLSGHLQPRIQMALDIYKDNRGYPFDHPHAINVLRDERGYIRERLEKYVDTACKGEKRYSQVVVALYVMSCSTAHSDEISEIFEEIEQLFLELESTSVATFHAMLSSGADSNMAPSLRFLKIARDLMSEEELAECDGISSKFWGWKKTKFKKQREKMVKGMRRDEEDGESAGDDDETEEVVGDSKFTPLGFKIALLCAMFTEEYLCLRDRRDFSANRVIVVCKEATRTLPELEKRFPDDPLSGRHVPMHEYDLATLKSSKVFRQLFDEQARRRGVSTLKTNRAVTHVQYTKIFFVDSPCVLKLPGHMMKDMHNPVTRFLGFYLRDGEEDVSKQRMKKTKKKEEDDDE